LAGLRKILFGPPLASTRVAHERLTKAKALAVFSSDALSSVAYATEEILIVLVMAGTVGLVMAMPVAMAITGLLMILAFSYRQTIYAYPGGGGAYIVAKDNLGVLPGLVAGAALLVDYVLTVAVSISSGVAAITSALPYLQPYAVEMALAFIVIIALGNLRGIRESATIFALPTYAFIIMALTLVSLGVVRMVFGLQPVEMPRPLSGDATVQSISLLLVLRAFSSGCTALTGVEAISNGIPAFKPPESRNAAITLFWMAGILAVMFLGITTLSQYFQIVPQPDETVLSQLGRAVFGTGPLYYALQAATATILVLAANTSFADFPRLSSIVARDGYMPRQFMNLGDRLVFSNGIVMLAVLAGLLVVIFGASTHHLIPLYAVGVFLSFTLSQAGMVAHHLRQRQRGWQIAAIINGIGALATTMVLMVTASVKLLQGAWIVLLVLPLLIYAFMAIHRHYVDYAERVHLDRYVPSRLPKPVIIIPIAGPNRATALTLDYARTLAEDVRPVIVVSTPAEARAAREEWRKAGFDQQLVVLESPYRSIVGAILSYIDEVADEEPGRVVTVIMPEIRPPRWWHFFLHNQTALMIRGALLFQPHRVVATLPYALNGDQHA